MSNCGSKCQMSSFSGEYRYSIDDKNRLTIPSKILEQIDVEKEGKGFVITRGLDECLYMYTTGKWKELVPEIGKLDVRDEASRFYQHYMLSKVHEVPECDQQWRILIPPYMKELAKLEKKVVIVGMYERIEIWDEKTWDKHYAALAAAYKKPK